MGKIDSLQRVRGVIGPRGDLVGLKIHNALNATARDFIARSPMAFLATCGADGMPTVSPKGDRPGFVHVADERTLLIPERKGNKLILSLQNILENPKVGLIFLLPGTCETLRVQGKAELTDDRALRERLSSRGNSALLVMKLAVESCYFHCAKAFLRSELWKPQTWTEPMTISFGEEIAQEGGVARSKIAEFDAGVQSRYKTDL
jgi:PPOX class probable FMN-dependent enzyme